MSLEKVLLEVYQGELSEADAKEASVNLGGFVQLLQEIFKSQEQNQSEAEAVPETAVENHINGGI